MSTDVVAKLWGFCHTLRHDGVSNADYLEQITYLLFLKMADEREIELPSYKTLDPKTPYVVVCDTGRRSSAAAFLLNERGFDAYCLRGGMLANKLGPD